MSRAIATPIRRRRPALIAAVAGVPAAAVALAATFGFSSVAGYITADKGDRGSLVKCVQRALNSYAAKNNTDKIAVDGIYGNATKALVTDFQKAKDLPVSGKMNKTTSLALAKYVTKDSACNVQLRSKTTRYDVDN
jgi:peptidoglycan hydrolase-like protein with peptidoglycan-binding domain